MGDPSQQFVHPETCEALSQRHHVSPVPKKILVMSAPESGHVSDPRILSERIRPGDPYFNYCWWPYEPPVPGEGKLRASSLLWLAIQQMPEAAWLAETVASIQAALGDFRSVYGAKQVDGEWSLEVYLYDYEREGRVVSVERLAAACQGRLTFPDTVGSHVPYFMFSFDLNAEVAAVAGKIETVHVYVGNPGSTVSSGISYGFTDDPTATEMENFYFFFAADDVTAIRDKVACSAFLNGPSTVEQSLLRPELMECHTICLANKRTSNTVYFSGVNVRQLMFFLNWQNYPSVFTDFVRDHQHELDHLLYDVGVDYQVRNNTVRFVKSGVYGVF